jgi:hypothetical protein
VKYRRLLTVAGATAAMTIATAGAAGASKAPNQGDASKVLTADNPNVSCAYPTPLDKVEGGGLGRTIHVSASTAIDYVTVKSGQNASIESASFDTYSGTITLSKDVSNYVVWVCDAHVPDDGGGN